MTEPVNVRMVVNKVEQSRRIEPRTTLLDFLRDHLGLPRPANRFFP